jgi:hypothetical protein
MGGCFVRASVFVMTLACIAGVPCSAFAAGTARVQQRDGAVRIYKDVHIKIAEQRLWITSSDRVGTLVIGKASCTGFDKLIRCLPYTAVLEQRGAKRNLVIENGSAWFNPSKTTQTLPQSSTKLPPHGVLMTLKTKAGTYVSLSGTVDEMVK